MVRVQFVDGQQDRESPILGPFPRVQLTYESLRVGPEDEPLAFCAASKDHRWHIVDQHDNAPIELRGTYWSDVVIF